ncbi:MAG: UbiA family prenyltransferase [Armatimonadetes bacterium]|nr:4-hydroxybenzoate octaprenyltransferase [Armatimonadota bacterium]MBS1703218.1 UbiA family prenyltransferase [Armatimonadota bacterium]
MAQVSGQASGWKAFRAFLEMIKFEHSIFALPYAMIAMIWASPSGWPGLRVFLLILVAMVSCRTAAMTYNRIADRDIDAKNDRTKMRAIPSGLLSLRTVNLYFYASIILFLGAAAMLNSLTLILSPIALFVTIFYSRTKRFTWLCHYWLGLSLGIAPSAAWIAVKGDLSWPPIFLTLAVLLWTAGFDIIYALQDEEFDRENGLRSIPARFGRKTALIVSRLSHLFAVVFLVQAFAMEPITWVGWLGVIFAGVMLTYEQSLVKPNDLSRVNFAFFTLNGCISVGVFVFVLIDRLIR